MLNKMRVALKELGMKRADVMDHSTTRQLTRQIIIVATDKDLVKTIDDITLALAVLENELEELQQQQ